MNWEGALVEAEAVDFVQQFTGEREAQKLLCFSFDLSLSLFFSLTRFLLLSGSLFCALEPPSATTTRQAPAATSHSECIQHSRREHHRRTVVPYRRLCRTKQKVHCFALPSFLSSLCSHRTDQIYLLQLCIDTVSSVSPFHVAGLQTHPLLLSFLSFTPSPFLLCLITTTNERKQQNRTE